MFHLVYASTATKPFSVGELLEVLHQARKNNADIGVTGLLLYKDGAFMQVLEGEEDAVQSLYAEILRDGRHCDVRTLVAMPVGERQFPNWSMGFKNLDDEPGADAVPGYNAHPDLPSPDDGLAWQGSVAMSLLASFKYADC
jgi:hypothetical protein